jgi:hypothetical protein
MNKGEGTKSTYWMGEIKKLAAQIIGVQPFIAANKTKEN